MNALPQKNYKDPLDKLIADEEASCKGCRWRMTEAPFTVAVCANSHSGQLEAKNRCKHYEERP
jgi:hypothetical protein